MDITTTTIIDKIQEDQVYSMQVGDLNGHTVSIQVPNGTNSSGTYWQTVEDTETLIDATHIIYIPSRKFRVLVSGGTGAFQFSYRKIHNANM